MPTRLPMTICDLPTGHMGALGAMTALLYRAQSGSSYLVSTSLTQSAMFLQSLGSYSPALSRELVGKWEQEPVDPLTETPGWLLRWASSQLPKHKPHLFKDEFFDIHYGPAGQTKVLKPPVKMDLTPCGYRLPPRPFGYDKVTGWLKDEKPLAEEISVAAKL